MRRHDAALKRPASACRRRRRGVEPLCAFYAPSCLPAIEQSLADGDRRVIGFHERVRVARLPADEVSAFGDPGLLFMNVNTQDDLARAEQILNGRRK